MTRPALEDAVGRLDPVSLERTCFDLTAIPSATGEEAAAARWVAARLVENGVEASVQPVADGQANVIARLGGKRPGPTLMLYAPLDTVFSGDDEEDIPWLPMPRRGDFDLSPTMVDGHVVGLGAENPKAFVACVMAAAAAIAAAGGPERGEILVAITSGGVPIYSRPDIERRPLGFGSGLKHLLDGVPAPDYALVAKPGYAAQTDEVGVCLFRIDVRGTLNYTGIRQLVPYRSAIVDAATIVVALEDWYAGYSERHRSAELNPQASTNAIRAGDPGRAAFLPSLCSIYIDVRTAPESRPDEVTAELAEFLDGFCGEHGIDYQLELYASAPGGRTPADSVITRAVVRAWEAVEGTPHQPRSNMSGVSDASLLRARGIDTVVVGVPRIDKPPQFAGFSMGVVSKESMMKLSEILVRSAWEVCSGDEA